MVAKDVCVFVFFFYVGTVYETENIVRPRRYYSFCKRYVFRYVLRV